MKNKRHAKVFEGLFFGNLYALMFYFQFYNKCQTNIRCLHSSDISHHLAQEIKKSV